MRKQQEAWAMEHGYQRISVKSMSCYPSMLRLLMASGYQMVGFEDNGSP
ncbi:hypothetical protein [Agarivorans gilvus]|nr:hypothetical protein [Agarivorans gilvus]